MGAASNRFALIEAVRGLAALLVVFSHTMPKEGWFYTYVFDPGKIGVVVFFFISGYLVIPSAARDRSAKRFLTKRLFRLYPLYWVSLVLAFAVWPSELAPLDWMANITMAQQLFGFENAIDVYWTLTIEVVLYLVITAFLVLAPSMLTQRFPLVLGSLGAVCLAAAVARWGLQTKIPVAVPLGLFCMFTGAQMRFLRNAGRSIIRPVLFYLAIAIPTCWIAYSFSTGFDETSSRYIITYIVGGLIFLAILQKPDIDLGRPVRALGDWSFGVYLFHMLFATTLVSWIDKGWTLFAVTLVLSIAISAPLYYLLERPAAAFGRSLFRKHPA
ncbi:acyltransferase family protein [Maricaulis sp.]|uniref:acyltransferase family protein n=1 Tax=Maricaulis sp. TaxID=1486257 RepID=UPI003A950EE3